jgi:hypothetical protein
VKEVPAVDGRGRQIAANPIESHLIPQTGDGLVGGKAIRTPLGATIGIGENEQSQRQRTDTDDGTDKNDWFAIGLSEHVDASNTGLWLDPWVTDRDAP